MPLRNSVGTAIAALTLAAPTVRFKRGEILNLLPALSDTVGRIRADLLDLAGPNRFRRI